MTVYVDPAIHKFGRMIMCHCWADSEQELREMMDKIGVKQKWIQLPPKSSWIHFDICKSKRQKAIDNGAVETDRYGPLEFLARQSGDEVRLLLVQRAREKIRENNAAPQ